jgi:hypothetical protein
MVSSNRLFDHPHMITFEKWLTDSDIHPHPLHIIMASWTQLKLQSCATSYNLGTLYWKKIIYYVYGSLARTSKNEPKMWGNPNQEVRKDITVCPKETILTWKQMRTQWNQLHQYDCTPWMRRSGTWFYYLIYSYFAPSCSLHREPFYSHEQQEGI